MMKEKMLSKAVQAVVQGRKQLQVLSDIRIHEDGSWRQQWDAEEIVINLLMTEARKKDMYKVFIKCMLKQ